MRQALQTLILTFILSLTLFNCEKKKELSYVEFEQQVFYEIFPTLIDKIYRDKRLMPPPPPPPEILEKNGFGLENGYNNAYENYKKSDNFRNRQILWEKKKDSIDRDTSLIYIAIPDSISRFEKEDMYELVNHFKNENLVIDSKNFDFNSGFKIDLNKLKTNHKKLRFKYMSEFPKGREFWTTDYDFYLTASLGLSRILFDKTKSFGVLDVGFVEGRLNGGGSRIFIKKDKNGKWVIDKIKETWVS